jgi:hypothetical protein
MNPTHRIDPTVDHVAEPAITPPANQPTGRPHRASVVAAVIAFACLPLAAGCSDDDNDRFGPTTSVPPVGTGLVPSDGVVVPLEPGSNLPPLPGERDGDGGTDGEGDGDGGMDVDGDGRGEGDTTTVPVD